MFQQCVLEKVMHTKNFSVMGLRHERKLLYSSTKAMSPSQVGQDLNHEGLEPAMVVGVSYLTPLYNRRCGFVILFRNIQIKKLNEDEGEDRFLHTSSQEDEYEDH